MVILAAILIVQMVYWMRKHGRTLKREMETSLSANLQALGLFGIEDLYVCGESATTRGLEPTAGVDIELRRSMWTFLTELNQKGITIILTTHYLEEAEAAVPQHRRHRPRHHCR